MINSFTGDYYFLSNFYILFHCLTSLSAGEELNLTLTFCYYTYFLFPTKNPTKKQANKHTTNTPIFNTIILFAFLCFQFLQLFINFIIFHFLIQTLFLHSSRTFISDPSSISSLFLLFNSVTHFL